METENILKSEKKIYNTPELVEHGDLMELTQGEDTGYTDTDGASGSGDVERPPFIVAP